LKCF